MSCHKRSYQCFNALGEGSQKPSLPFKRHTTRLPRIPQHGITTHHDLFEECCLCLEYRHAQAMEAAENQLLPFYHAHPPYHHHHPHRYVLRGPSRPEEAHPCNECHLHHHRCNKTVVLVKNSDPSHRRTVVLHHRSLRSFALFLEELSELMQYHIRRLYTQEGQKIDNIQSLLQSSGVLVCVGREPTHPSIAENFQKTQSDNKLPKLSVKSSSTGCTGGHERLAAKTGILPPNLKADSRISEPSVSSNKSGPDGTDSPDVVGSQPHTGDSMREDDIEKLVHVNKDGSLTMEMKVRFRLQNEQTLHWSTKVRKTTGGTCDTQGHKTPHFARVCDVSCSESESVSADDACFYQGHAEEPHCAHCCSHCRDYDLWKNIPGAQGANRCIQSSSSSASSLTVVSRKTVVERQTASRSSEELPDEVVESEMCVTQSTAETVEFCTVQSGICSPEITVPSSSQENDEAAGLRDFTVDELDVKPFQESELGEQSVCCTSQILAGDERNDDGKDGSLRASRTSQNSNSGKTSNHLERPKKKKTSKPFHPCHCGASVGPRGDTERNVEPKEDELQRDPFSAMSVKSNASECKKEGRGSKSAMSVCSHASTTCNSDVLDVASEGIQTDDDEETQKRPSSCVSVKSVMSDSVSEHRKSEEDVEEERALSSMSSKSKASIKSKGSRGSSAVGKKEAEGDLELRTPSVMSALSNVSAELKHLVCEASEEEGSQHPGEENETDTELRAQSGISENSFSKKSRSSEVTGESAEISDNENIKGENEQRPQSTLSVKSARSVKSNISSKSKTMEFPKNGREDSTEDEHNEEQSEEKVSKTRASRVVSDKSVRSESSAVSRKYKVSPGDGGNDDGQTSERARSAVSIESAKTNVSVASTKSKASHDIPRHKEDFTGRSSCMSDTSGKSVSSVRSSKCCDELLKEDGEESKDERGPSAASSKSLQSNLSAKSTFSNKSKLSKSSVVSAERNTAGPTDHKERAPSKMSAASVKSSKSNAAAAPVCVPSETCGNASEETVPESETEKRSVSSMSVQSDKSDISSISNTSDFSAHDPAAEGLEILPGNDQEVRTVHRATSSASVESVEPHAGRAPSAESHISMKSSKTNTTKVCSNLSPDEQTSEEEIQERALSALSAKTITSTNSAKSMKSKCSTDVLREKSAKTLDEKNDTELPEERPPSSMSARTIQSRVSERSTKTAERPQSASSAKSAKTNVSDVQTPATPGTPDKGDGTDETQQRTLSALSADTVQSITSTKSTKSKKHDDPGDKSPSNNEEHVERASSKVSARSGGSTKSNVSRASRRSKAAEVCLNDGLEEVTNCSVCAPDEEESDEECADETRERSHRSLSAKTTKSTISATSSRLKGCDCPAQENSAADEVDENRSPSVLSVRSAGSVKSQKSKASGVLCEPTDEKLNEGEPQEEEDTESCSRSSVSIESAKTDISVRSDESKCSTNVPVEGNPSRVKERNDDRGTQDRPESAVSAKSADSAKSNRSKASAASAVRSSHDPDHEERPASTQTINSDISAKSRQSARSDAAAAQNIESPSQDQGEVQEDQEQKEDRAGSCMSVRTSSSHVSDISHRSQAYALVAEDANGHEKTRERTPSTSSATSAKSFSAKSTQSAKSVKLAASKVSDGPAEVKRAPSAGSDQSAESNASAQSQTSVGTVSCAEGVKQESTEMATSRIASSAKDSEQRVPSAVSASSNRSRKAANTSRASAGNASDKSTEESERSQSNMSPDINKSDILASSRATTSCEVLSEDNSMTEQGNPQRPPSTLSLKSAHSSISAKSSKSQAANTPGEEQYQNAGCASSCSSNKSTKSRHSNASGGSTRSKALDVSSELGASITSENTEEDSEIRALSPVSAKSVKTNVTSASTKSKASNGSKRSKASKVFEREDQTPRTESVLSLRSNTSLSTIQSNRSDKLKNEEETDSRCVMSTKSAKSRETNQSIANEIPTEDYSEHHSDGNTAVTSDRTPSVMSVKSDVSVKSRKSKVSDVTVEESTTYMEERTVSPISAKSNVSDVFSRSEVPAVTVEESEDRSPTAKSSKSKASGRSKKSKSSELQGKKSDRTSQSSLSVHSHLSIKSKKSKGTDVSTVSISPENTKEVVNPPCLNERDRQDPSDREDCETNMSRGQGTEETDAGVNVTNSTTSQSAQDTKANKPPAARHAESSESDLSQTLSSSDITKEICETSAREESKCNESKRIANGQQEATENGGSAINKSDKSSKHKKKKKDTDDFELVPSILPNASPTEVVNEWLKKLPEEADIYNIEELDENCEEVKSGAEAEEGRGAEHSRKNVESKAENSQATAEGTETNVAHGKDCQASTESIHEDNNCIQSEDDSKMINSSIQVMKVLLNPKLDRCNSLPEISPVYGRKLSTSAKGFLDCLVKLQIINHDPKNANKKDKRYQELMSILQSLWLSEPPVNERLQNTNDHQSLDEEYNHTSSSGVDVNSGSTGSGKSSDGVKSSNDVSGVKAENEPQAQWQSEREEGKQEDNDPGTDETIRSNDSPKEPPETPSTSNKSSGDSSSHDQKLPEDAETRSQEDTKSQSPILSEKTQLSKKQSQDPDPVWVLTLLTNIERQFMTHYINAMKEFKVRWNLEDNDQLDMMINELKTEVQKRIQMSIEREVKKLQGLPRPPKEAISRASSTQREDRKRRLKIRSQHSMDSQTEKSDESITGTSYSDQRSENIDDCCPCETCANRNMASRPAPAAEVKTTPPVVMDYDLKRILLMKTNASAIPPVPTVCACQSGNDNETKAVANLVDKVIISAVKEVEDDTKESFAFAADDVVQDVVQQDKTEPAGSIVETGKTEDEWAESDRAITDKSEDEFEKRSEDENEVEKTIISLVQHQSHRMEQVKSRKVDETEKTSGNELPDRANQVVHDETDESGNSEIPNNYEPKEATAEISEKEESSTKQEADSKETKKDWSTIKKRLLPPVRMILQRNRMTKSGMNSENNDKVSRAETADEIETSVSNKEESEEEEAEGTTTENEDASAEAATSECKSDEEENEEEDAGDNKSTSSEEDLLEVTPSATAEAEETAAETSSVVTVEHASAKDEESDTDAAEEETGTAGEDEASEDLDAATNDDETADEKEANCHKLSGEPAEDSAEDEFVTEKENSVTSNDELDKNHIETTVDDSSGEPGEVGTTEDVWAVEKQTTVSGDEKSEDDTVVASSTDHESDDVEEEKVDTGEETGSASETDTAELLTCSLEAPTGEDEIDAPETFIAAKGESEKDVVEEEGTDVDEEKLPAISEMDESNDSATADESSEEPRKGATTKGKIAPGTETDVALEGEPQEKTTEDEISENEEASEAATVDNGEEPSAVSQDDSAEDVEVETNEGGTEEGNSEWSTERAEKDSEDEQTEEGATISGNEDAEETNTTATSESESEQDDTEEEESEGKPVTAKRKPDLADISEHDNEEEETDAGTSEHGSCKDTAEEATSAAESDAEGGTAEDKESPRENEIKEELSVKTTEDEEEDETSADEASSTREDDSGEGIDSFLNDETSAEEKTGGINKAYNESAEKKQEETIDEEEQDVCDNTETDPGSTREESSRAVSENESEEESNRSSTDEEKPANNPRTDTDDGTEQEDSSTVRNDDEESGMENSGATSDNETAQEPTDQNETASETEHHQVAEELDERESSEKNEEEEKSEEGHTFSHEGSSETSGEECEEVTAGNESGGESKWDSDEATSQNETEDHEMTKEELREPEMEDEDTKTDDREESMAEDAYGEEEAGALEEQSNTVKHGSEQSKRRRCDDDKKNLEESEKEGEETETPNENWSGDQGESADGEDEAEEDSDEPEEETDGGRQLFVLSKADSRDAFKEAAKETMLMPLETLIKRKVESEDGAYADVEDSETEINSQEEVMSLESKSLKKC